MRNTGKLKSDKQLKSGGSLGGGGQLVPLKSLSAKKRLKARSRKQEIFYQEQRIPFVVDFLERHPQCMFKLWVYSTTIEESPAWDYTGSIITSCGKKAVDVHELLPRGRGGNAVPIEGQHEDEQFAGLCRLHHVWVTSNPKDAKRLGYTR